MLRLFSGSVDHSVLRAILVADAIGFAWAFVFYLAVGFAVRAWSKKKQRKPQISADDPDLCWHCSYCHRPLDNKPEAKRCIGSGRYCDDCRERFHPWESS